MFIKTHQTVQLELVNFITSKLYLYKADGKGGERKRKRREKQKEKEGGGGEEKIGGGRWGRKRKKRNNVGSIKKEAHLFAQWILIFLLGVSQGLGTKGETTLIPSNFYSLVNETDM